MKSDDAVNPIFLDSSALLAWIYNEPGGEEVERALTRAESKGKTLSTAQASLAEISHSLGMANRAAYPQRLGAIRSAPIYWIPLTDEDAIAAGLLRLDFKMSFADALIITLARRLGSEFWHKDPEFDQLPSDFLKVHRLPYKSLKGS